MVVKIVSIIKFYTILLLSEGPKHGYELIKGLEEKLGKKISASQVYPFLDILKKNKFIEIKEIGERGKKVYILTKDGRNFINNFIQRSGDLLAVAIEPKLTECAHCACKVYKGGHKEKMRGKELMFCCSHCAKSFKKGG